MSKPMSDFIPDWEHILFLDVGNYSIKAAYKKGRHWKRPDSGIITNAEVLIRWIRDHGQTFQLIVICSVVPEVTRALSSQLPKQKVRVLKTKDLPEDLLDYETPETLGVDRFFSCYGAVSQTQKSAVVIDAGTACTIDFMSADFIYRGGVIMPGLGVVEKSVREHIPTLPHVSRQLPDVWPGRSTRQSLQWGVAGMYQGAISHYLEKYRQSFKAFDVFITGGDAKVISEWIECSQKIHPMLLFEGMQRFLERYI